MNFTVEFDENPFFTPTIFLCGVSTCSLEYYESTIACISLTDNRKYARSFLFKKINKSKNGKTKIYMDILFHTVQKFVRNLPILCGLFHPYQCSYKLNRRTLADAQKDL